AIAAAGADDAVLVVLDRTFWAGSSDDERLIDRANDPVRAAARAALERRLRIALAVLEEDPEGGYELLPDVLETGVLPHDFLPQDIAPIAEAPVVGVERGLSGAAFSRRMAELAHALGVAGKPRHSALEIAVNMLVGAAFAALAVLIGAVAHRMVYARPLAETFGDWWVFAGLAAAAVALGAYIPFARRRR
ncbi:MAG: hypothetical protein AAFR16_08895, partial [Pseudomonadota bacterium]